MIENIFMKFHKLVVWGRIIKILKNHPFFLVHCLHLAFDINKSLGGSSRPLKMDFNV